MGSAQTLEQLLKTPSPELAWTLRGDLLMLGHAPDSAPQQILGDYHHFLVGLAQATSSAQYTELAYWLSAGAALVSFVSDTVSQFNPIALLSNPLSLLGNLMPKGFDEGLDVMAAGNYVSSAETVLPALNQQNAWRLYNHFWQLATSNTPTKQRQQLDQLFQPFHAETRPVVQAVILGRLYQYALLVALSVE